MKVEIGDVVRISKMLKGSPNGIPVEAAIVIRNPDGWTSTFLPPLWGVSGVVIGITEILPTGDFMYLVEIEDAGGRAEIHSSRVEETFKYHSSRDDATPNKIVNADIGDVVRIGAIAEFDKGVETSILIQHPDGTASQFRPPVYGEILEKKPSGISGAYIYRVKVNGGRAFIHSSRVEAILWRERNSLAALTPGEHPIESLSAEMRLLQTQDQDECSQLVSLAVPSPRSSPSNPSPRPYDMHSKLEKTESENRDLKLQMAMTQNLLMAGATVYQRSTGQELILDQKCRIGWGKNSVEGWLAWDGRTFIRVPAADLTSAPMQAPLGTFHWPNWLGMITVIGFATVIGHALTHYWMGR